MSGVLSAGQPLSEALDGGCRVVSSDKNGLDTFVLGKGLKDIGIDAAVQKNGQGIHETFNCNVAALAENKIPVAPTPALAPTYQSQPSYGQA